jgi:hypothetical protein
VKTIEYPKGAAVLSNIRCIGRDIQGFKKYEGILCEGISFGSSKMDVLKVFGYPNDPEYDVNGRIGPDENDNLMRWDREGYCFFARFDTTNTLIVFSIQLPVANLFGQSEKLSADGP